jgi:hypothetical protein
MRPVASPSGQGLCPVEQCMTQVAVRVRTLTPTTAKRSSDRRDRGRRAGSALILGSAAATGVVVLLLLTPATIGSIVVPAVFPYGKHSPPFTGTKHVGQVVVSSGCSASAFFVTPPQFNLSSGIGRAYGKSSVKSCGPPGFSDFGATVGTVGFDSYTFVPKPPTPTQIWINISVSYTYNLSATPQSPAGGPLAWASYSVKVVETSFDITNSSLGPGCTLQVASTTNGSATGNASGGSHGPIGCGITGPLGFVAGDRYIVQIYVVVSEFAYAPSATGTHASARADMASGTHELNVHSWTIH